jgi:hypothetical protein
MQMLECSPHRVVLIANTNGRSHLGRLTDFGCLAQFHVRENSGNVAGA